MKHFLFLMLLLPICGYAQRLSYTISPKNPKASISTVLVVSNKIPVEGAIPKILSALRERGHDLTLSKEEINLTGLTAANSPFAPEIKYALKFNVLNQNVGEALIRMDIQYFDLSTGAQRGMSLSRPRDNISMIAAEIAKFIDGDKPAAAVSSDSPKFTGASGGEALFPAASFLALRKGDEFFVRFDEPREGMLEIKAQVKRIETATNTAGAFEKMVVVDNKTGIIKTGDKVIKSVPQRNRFSLSLFGTAALSKAGSIKAYLDGLEYSGQKLWGGGFIVQGEYEKFLPYGFTSTTAFGLNIDGTINTFVLTGVGWRWIHPQWELVPSLRLGLAFAPLAFAGSADNLQGSAIRFGMDIGVSFLYRVGSSFSLGFDIGLQYWFYTLSVLYRGSDKVFPSFSGGGIIPLAYLYPRFGLKFAWKF